MTRSRLALVEPAAETPEAALRWLALPAEHSAYRLLHVVAELDDIYRVAPVAAALDEAGAFEHVVADVSRGHHAGPALAELGRTATVCALPGAGGSASRRLGALLDAFDGLLGAEAFTAAIVYSDDDPALACALSATRRHVPLVHVLVHPGPVTAAGRDARVLRRLADVVLVADDDEAKRLEHEHVQSHRIHVVGDPLMDVVREYAGKADVAELCRNLGLEPGAYTLVAATGQLPSLLEGAVRVLDAPPRLVVRRDADTDDRSPLPHALIDGARIVDGSGPAARLGLERAAGAIVTDSGRIAERAAVLGVPCRLVTGDEDWDLAGLWARRRSPGPSATTLRTGGAPERLASVIVANFARVVAKPA